MFMASIIFENPPSIVFSLLMFFAKAIPSCVIIDYLALCVEKMSQSLTGRTVGERLLSQTLPQDPVDYLTVISGFFCLVLNLEGSNSH